MKHFVSSAALLLVALAVCSYKAEAASRPTKADFLDHPVPCRLYNGKPSDERDQHFYWIVADKWFPPRHPILDGEGNTLNTLIKKQDGLFRFELGSNSNGKGERLEMTSQAADDSIFAMLPYAQFKVDVTTKNKAGKVATTSFWMSTNIHRKAFDADVPFHWQDFQHVVVYQKITPVS